MKLFLATDALEDVRWATARGLVDGVVLPDAALSGGATQTDAHSWLREFCRDLDVPVFVALNGDPSQDAFSVAHDIGRVADNVVVQLALNDHHVEVMHRLSIAGVRIAATFVGTAAQAFLAAKAGASFVFLDVDRINASGGSGAAVVEQARAVLNQSSSEADVVALFPATGAPLIACALAGADAAVVGTAALRASLAYPFTDQTLADGAKRPASGERLKVTTS